MNYELWLSISSLTAVFPLFLGLWFFVNCKMYEYHFVHEKKNWEDAKQYCKNNYTDLATVYDMTDIHRLLNSSGTCSQSEAWIGLSSQSDRNMMWHWSLPGEQFDQRTATWSSGGSHLERNSSCGFINKDLTWENRPCTETGHFLCYNGESVIHFKHLIPSQNFWL